MFVWSTNLMHETESHHHISHGLNRCICGVTAYVGVSAQQQIQAQVGLKELKAIEVPHFACRVSLLFCLVQFCVCGI